MGYLADPGAQSRPTDAHSTGSSFISSAICAVVFPASFLSINKRSTGVTESRIRYKLLACDFRWGWHPCVEQGVIERALVGQSLYIGILGRFQSNLAPMFPPVLGDFPACDHACQGD